MTGEDARGVVMIGAGEEGRGLFPLLREDTLSLTQFFGPGLAGPTAITALVLLGAISGATGGLLLLLWAVFSFFVCLWVYTWVDQRGRQERISALALTGMPRLASRVIALYSLPTFSPDRGSASGGSIRAVPSGSAEFGGGEESPTRL